MSEELLSIINCFFKRFLFLVPAKTNKQIPIGYRLCRRVGVAGDNTCNGASGELRRFDNTSKGEDFISTGFQRTFSNINARKIAMPKILNNPFLSQNNYE
jgi:hypothetical protein